MNENPFWKRRSIPELIRRAPIEEVDRGGCLPVSYQQERLWFLDQLERGAGAAYHVEGAIWLRGPLNVEALAEALQSVVARHESLRTTFGKGGDGQPVLVVREPRYNGFSLHVEDASAYCQEELRQRVSQLRAEPFDLARGPLFRAWLLVVSPAEHVLVVGGHHAVLDGWSVRLLLGEVSSLYRSHRASQRAALPALPVQYADYASWQRSLLSGERLAAETAWWREHLSGIPDAITLPFDQPRPKAMDYRGGIVPIRLPPSAVAALKALGEHEGTTLFMALQAALATLFMRLGAGEDIVIGTSEAGRPRREIEPLVGFFANTLAIRQRLDPHASFKDQLGVAKTAVLEALAHKDVPFSHVVEAIAPARALSHAPVVQIMLVLQNNPETGSLLLPDVEATPFVTEAHGAPVDLTINLAETDDGLVGSLTYAAQLFDHDTAERIARMFGHILTAAANSPSTKLADLPLMDGAERDAVVAGFNPAPEKLDARETLSALFSHAAREHPNTTAIIEGDQELTYADLDRASNRLARYLVGLGVERETVVAVCLNRSQALIVALLGIWKAGGAYLALEPDHPADRHTAILEDAGATLLLTTHKHVAGATSDRPIAPSSPLPMVLLDDLETTAAIDAVPDTTLRDEERRDASSANLAYITYTSGSTGTPKGIAASHGAVCNFIGQLAATIGAGPNTTTFLRTSPSFDAVNREIWLPLTKGGTIAVHKGDGRDVTSIVSGLRRSSTRFLNLTPAILETLVTEDFLNAVPQGCAIYSSGDHLDPDLVRSVLERRDDLTMINGYGPSETTMNTTWTLVGPPPGDCLRGIGAPIGNTTVYVVDGQLEPVPVGVWGEILVGGTQVSRGYVGRSGLTAERFVADPFSSEPGARLYRTGDYGRWRSDGTLEFRGRIDTQVKVRGMRVELGEIEAALTASDGVAQAAVVARTDETGTTTLVAHLVPDLLSKSIAGRNGRLPKPVELGLFFFGSDGLADETASAGRYDLILEAAERADGAGLRAVWTPERHFHEFGGQYPSPAVMGAALAARTRNLAIRAGSVVLPLNHPIRVAEDWAVIDNLSAGRAGVSFASGWHRRDFVLNPGGYDTRKGDMAALIATVRKLWSGEEVGFWNGEETVPIAIRPRAVQPDIPIWLTSAGNPETFIEAGRLEANLLTTVARSQPDVLARNIALYREAFGATSGGDTGHTTLMMHTFLAGTREAALEVVADPMRAYLSKASDLVRTSKFAAETDALPDVAVDFALTQALSSRGLFGAPSDVLERLRQLRALGVDEIACLVDFGLPNDTILDGLDYLFELNELAKKEARAGGRAVSHLMAHEKSKVLEVDLRGVVDLEAIRNKLKQTLPEYMVPSAFSGVSHLPLTTTGKVDRQQLPDGQVSLARASYAPPAGDTEVIVAEAFKGLLGLERVGRLDDFFALGGHSLIAVRLTVRLEAATGNALPLRALFEAPTVAGIAAALDALESGARFEPIDPIDRSQAGCLSHSQERLWFLEKLEGYGGAFTNTFDLALSGHVDEARLREVIGVLYARHEVLRLRIGEQSGVPVVRFRDPSEVPLTTVDVVDMATERQATVLEKAKDHRLDLKHGVFRAQLVRIAPNAHRLLISIHHVAHDGVSFAILLREIEALWRDPTAPLPALPIQYADFAAWQRRELAERERANSALGKGLNYFRETLKNPPAPLSLPADHQRPLRLSFAGSTIAAELPSDLVVKLQALADQQGATLFMVLESALAVLLSRYSGARDLIVGTAVAGRAHPDLETVVGPCFNIVALRHRFKRDMSFRALLADTRTSALNAFDHQLVPFEAVIDAVVERRLASHAHAPLFQVMFQLHTEARADPSEPLDLGGLAVTARSKTRQVARHDLSLDLYEKPDGSLAGTLEYMAELFEPARMQRLLRHYQVLLAGIVENPDSTIEALPLIDQAERAELIKTFNNAAVPLPAGQSIVDLFEVQARKQPDATAVVSETVALTYGELFAQAASLSARLKAEGIGPEQPVGLVADPKLEFFVALWAIWMAGGAYLALDPGTPPERLRFILSECRPPVVLHAGVSLKASPLLSSLASDRAGSDCATPVLLDLEDAIKAPPTASPGTGRHDKSDRLHEMSAAYVLYTSGSTGTPKGVVNTFGALRNLAEVMARQYPAGPADRILQFCLPSFVRALEEYVWAFCSGASLHLFPRNGPVDGSALGAFIHEHQITHACMVPSALQLLPARPCPTLRTIVVAGEALPASAASRFPQGPTLVNEYGATETAGIVTGRVPTGDSVPPHIGEPLTNSTVTILDPRLEPVPIGVPGEIYVGGRQVARGYLARPGLTVERFVADPFSSEPGARLFRTGDLGRWRPDGTIEHLGRLDFQVQIRGMRVEPGEVEAVLADHESVGAAAVVGRFDSGDSVQLDAYIVPAVANTDRPRTPMALPGTVDLRAIDQHLERYLPEHMRPSTITVLPELPKTASGKVARLELPDPGQSAQPRTTDNAPATETERRVAATFQDLLGVTGVGRGDGFFDLGGHSLMAVKLVSRLTEETGKSLALRTVFEAKTVASIAAAIDHEPQRYRPLVALSEPKPGQSHTGPRPYSIVCFHPVAGNVVPYAQPAVVERLSQFGLVLGVQARGLELEEPPFATYEDMLHSYTEAIAALEDVRPFVFVGWSMGGIVAYDVASRLADRGREVVGLAILDGIDRGVISHPQNGSGQPAAPTASGHTMIRAAGEQGSAATLNASTTKRAPSGPRVSGADLVERSRALRLWHIELLKERSSSRNYHGPALILRAADTAQTIDDPALGWAYSCSPLETLDVPHLHDDLLNSEAVPTVIGAVADWIETRLIRGRTGAGMVE
ncbi:MAG: amino acid adenylation domain-containing protein [Devosia sp.]